MGPATIEPDGLIGPSARLTGTPVSWPASDKIRIPAGGNLSVSLFIKPDAAAPNAPPATLYQQGPLRLVLEGGRLRAELGRVTVNGGQIAPATWSQIVLTAGGGKLTLFVNAAQVGEGDLAQMPAIDGPFAAGAGYQGLIDELEIASALRSPEWIRLSYAAQSADAKLIASQTQTSDKASSKSGGSSYFGILFRSLTTDGWVVIGILVVMFFIAVAVMISKALYVSRTEGANRLFLQRFREVQDVLAIDAERSAAHSSLYRLYRAGRLELAKREVGPESRVLSAASLDAVKAAIDADTVREGYRLNAQMVLLTIAISGGPFLGLLGTVIGVMITFASIAAAGDVNVNAIAPGIAAALLATVAGLTVAIPSLFGYNYLSSRIKTISADMQIFVDEFVTRVAETYGEQ